MAAHAPDGQRALVLLSGGLDSTVTLYWARERYRSVAAVAFDYGQRHRVELQAAEAIAKRAGISFQTQFVSVFGENPLLASKKSENSRNLASQAKTFIPGRNLLFLTQTAQIAAVGGFGAILAGIEGNPLDPDSYPDTHQMTLLRLGDALDRGIYGRPGVTQYRFPLASMTKAQILDEAALLPGCWEALAYSHTCFEGIEPPCGLCSGCVARLKGFVAHGSLDPLLARLEKEGQIAKKAKRGLKNGWHRHL